MENILIKVILISFLGFLLSACGTTNPAVEPQCASMAPVPSTLTKEVLPEPPPNTQEYLSKSLRDREDILVEKFRKQTQNLETANSQIRSIKEWSDQQTELYKN